MILRSPGGGIEAFASGPFEGVAPEEDVEGAFFLLEEVVDVFLEIGGDLVQGGEGRRSFVCPKQGGSAGDFQVLDFCRWLLDFGTLLCEPVQVEFDGATHP